MKIKKPHYELRRVYEDGCPSPVVIHPVTKFPWEASMDRRGFLGVAGISAATVLLGSGLISCGSSNSSESPGGAFPRIDPADGIHAHFRRVKALTFTRSVSGGDDELLSGSEDSTIKKWRFPIGSLERTYKASSISVNKLALSPDLKILISVEGASILRVFRVSDKRRLKTLRFRIGLEDLTITPDSKVLITRGSGYVSFWSLPEINLLKTFGCNIKSFGLSPDGKILVSSVGGDKIDVWRVSDALLLVTHSQADSTFAISPDNMILGLIKTSARGVPISISLWNLKDHLLINSWDAIAQSLVFSPDAKILVSTGSSKVQAWSIPDGFLLYSIDVRNTKPQFSPDGKFLVLVGGGFPFVGVYSTSDGSLIRSFGGYHIATISSNSKILALGKFNGEIDWFNLENKLPGQSLIDLKATRPTSSGATYEVEDLNPDSEGSIYTVPCGTPIPAEAICTCNCVPGTFISPPSRGKRQEYMDAPNPTDIIQGSGRCEPPGGGGGGGGTICTCNSVCTCNLVFL